MLPLFDSCMLGYMYVCVEVYMLAVTVGVLVCSLGVI